MADTLVDQGPWEVNKWANGVVVLQSDVFNHDVALIVNGDFRDYEEKLRYAEQLAKQMNEGVKALKEKGWT